MHRTRLSPRSESPSVTPSSSLDPAIGNQPSVVQPRTSQSSLSSTFLSSNIPSTPDLSDVEEERDDAHMRNVNQKLIHKVGLVKTSTPPDPVGGDLNGVSLRCANWKLLRKLGLIQSPTPPDSPKVGPTNNTPSKLIEEANDVSPTSPFTPPPTPPTETDIYNIFNSATQPILRSPYPVLVPSLSFRPPFKFGQTPLPEQPYVYLLPASNRSQSPSLRSESVDQPSAMAAAPQTPFLERHGVYSPASTPDHNWSLQAEMAHQRSTPVAPLQTLQYGSSPSAQLLVDMDGLSIRDQSPVVEERTPDPYHKSPIFPQMSGELSAEQQSRYTTRSVAKQKAEAEKQLSEYHIEPLSKEWEAKVEHALKHGHGSYTTHDLIKVVPPMGSKTTSQWLNDETINGYLKLVTDLGNKGQNAGAPPKYHAFTSFFMTTLFEKGYEGVKRWSKRAKIDGKKLYDVQDVFIPVNRNFHWTVLVVSPKNRAIRYYDSLGGNGRQYVAAALQWLRGELGVAFTEGEWLIENSASSPMQNNSSDCGVFAITTAKQLMLGRSPMAYGAHEIPVQRRRIVAELVAGKLL
jgi:hypothetical protein